MFGRKKKLICLILGDPEDATFLVKCNSNMNISELKDTIYNLKTSSFSNTDSHRLALYQVNIDLKTKNTQRTALSNPNIDVVNDLKSQLLLPVDNIKEKFQNLPKKTIHIIIVPRTAPTGGVAPPVEGAVTAGEPEDAAFLVKYDSNMNISELKDTIYNLRISSFSNTDSYRLALYQVNIDLTIPNLQRAALSSKNVDVVNDLGGQLLLPVDGVEEKFQDPPEKNIHLIVVPRPRPTAPIDGK
ncbi:hypothetical protein RclHR1_04330005 [Rhizophagus clarus]|uniref:Crinkler effector protein N-terminal domain-containing protein n=1 Tax=Rhizophagus clarus TaxID=94130 RepID=A0A2Z6SAL5_9GLOM|nr:hypothetical protein RclHR1_04330005 [Rhizophagus clarus]